MGIFLTGSQRDEVYQYLLVDVGTIADMEVYAITLASDEIRSIFRRLLTYVLQLIDEPRGADRPGHRPLPHGQPA
jgi:hypothetical protein